MDAHLLDLPLTMSVLGILGKLGYDAYKARTNGHSNGNGHTNINEVALKLIEERETGVREIKESLQANLEPMEKAMDRLVTNSEKANEYLFELVLINRDK